MRVLSMILCMVVSNSIVQALDQVSAGPEPDKELRFGMSTALSGPVAGLGRAMKDGVTMAFAEANAKGGVRGYKLRLIALDDSYHPPTAASNVKRLIEQDGVLAIVGNLGTPTARLALPVARQAGVLFYGAMTGDDALRPDPPDRYIINFRASYAREVTTILDHLLGKGIQPEEIAFFTQDDSYGASVHEDAVRQLEARGFAQARALAHGRYARNTLQVEAALVALIRVPVRPRAVIMVGAFRPGAKFILLARQVFPDMIFMNVSFVGSAPLKKLLDRTSPGPDLRVTVTEVVPPLDAALPAVQAFHDARARWSPGMDADAAVLEGYLAARILVRGLKAAPALTREGVIDGLLNLGQIDIGMGSTLYLGPARHQASRSVWPVNLIGDPLP